MQIGASVFVGRYLNSAFFDIRSTISFYLLNTSLEGATAARRCSRGLKGTVFIICNIRPIVKLHSLHGSASIHVVGYACEL